MINHHYHDRSGSIINAGSTVAVFFMLLFVGLAAGCSERDSSGSGQNTPVLNSPPNTSFPMPPSTVNSVAETGWTLPDGQRASIQDYKGRVLVLDFYATWCQPCRQSIPHLNALQKSFGSNGLQVVGLNVGGPDDRVKVADFSRELAIQYPLGFPDKSLIDLFLSDDNSIPQTFVFNRNGLLVKRFVGYDDSVRLPMQQAIESALTQGSP